MENNVASILKIPFKNFKFIIIKVKGKVFLALNY
jgi:hypothetical protein